MSSARPPVLCTVASTVGWPSRVRFAITESIVKLAAGAPPGPTERYSRMPTRLTWVMPSLLSGPARVSAQTTP
jgi:hypothetical protein